MATDKDTLTHLIFSKVCVPQMQRLLEPELLPQLVSLSRANVEDARERKGMPSVGVLSAVYLESRVIYLGQAIFTESTLVRRAIIFELRQNAMKAKLTPSPTFAV